MGNGFLVTVLRSKCVIAAYSGVLPAEKDSRESANARLRANDPRHPFLSRYYI